MNFSMDHRVFYVPVKNKIINKFIFLDKIYRGGEYWERGGILSDS